MSITLRGFICLILANSCNSQSIRGGFSDPCRENPDACMLPECWYVCGDTKKPSGLGANVPIDPVGYTTFNSVSGRLGTISGGERNFLSGLLGTISGGKDNIGTGNLSSVGGGENNKADGGESVISGGKNNIASGSGSVVPGGKCNIAGHKNSMAFGGVDSEIGDCISDGAKYCNTDEDGQVKFCNPKSVFEGEILVGNISISNKTIVGIGNIIIDDLIIIGVDEPDNENRTEITKNRIKSPEIETRAIRMRPTHIDENTLIDADYITEITTDKMTSPKVETRNVDIKEALLIGTSDDMTNKTRITRDKINSPEIETRIIRMRPVEIIGRRIQSTDIIYTVIDTTSITTETIMTRNIQTDIINGIPVSFFINLFICISAINGILLMLLSVYVIQYNKKYPKIIKNHNYSPKI
jgi:hypothetical protein